MKTIFQVYRIGRFDCKLILMRFNNISKEKFLWLCKYKGYITYGGFNTYIVQPGYHIECFDGESWKNLEEQWPAEWMLKNVFSLMK